MERRIDIISIPYLSITTGEQWLLEGEVRRVDGVGTTVILCHPNPLYGADMDNNVIDAFFHGLQDWSAFRFNFGGVGRSQGQFEDGAGEVQQVSAAIDFARKLAPEDTLHVVGYSFGAITAAVAALGRNDVNSFTGIALPFSLYPDLTRRMFDLQAASHIQLVLIAGTRDEFTSPASFEAWAARFHGPVEKVVMEGATHFFDGYEARLVAATRKAILQGTSK